VRSNQAIPQAVPLVFSLMAFYLLYLIPVSFVSFVRAIISCDNQTVYSDMSITISTMFQ
jgi:hypothetical protein